MGSSAPERIDGLVGTAVRGDYGRGSKSEHEAVYLATGEARYLLRRKGGPAYGDDELESLVGHRVECAGFLLGTTLLAVSIRVVD